MTPTFKRVVQKIVSQSDQMRAIRTLRHLKRHSPPLLPACRAQQHLLLQSSGCTLSIKTWLLLTTETCVWIQRQQIEG